MTCVSSRCPGLPAHQRLALPGRHPARADAAAARDRAGPVHRQRHPRRHRRPARRARRSPPSTSAAARSRPCRLNARLNRVRSARAARRPVRARSPASASTRSSPTRRTCPATTTSCPRAGPQRAWDAGRDGRLVLDRIVAGRRRTPAPGGSSCSTHSSLLGRSARSPTSRHGGLEADCVARRRGPLGPLMTARVRGARGPGPAAARPAPRGRRRHPRSQTRARRARDVGATAEPTAPQRRLGLRVSAICSLSWSTTDGSRSVVTSPSSRPLGDVAQQPPHDLARARLGQVVGPEDPLGARELADLVRDVLADVGDRSSSPSRSASSETNATIAWPLVLVALPIDRRLRDERVRDDRRLDLGRRHAVPDTLMTSSMRPTIEM